MSAKRVLSVGQCSADHGSISRMLLNRFGAKTVPASSPEEALALLKQESFDLVLVNRVFDYGGDSGLDFIGRCRQEAPSAPVMLVSNYADAQQQAAALGAAPGFGKASLSRDETLERLRPFLSSKVASPEGA